MSGFKWTKLLHLCDDGSGRYHIISDEMIDMIEKHGLYTQDKDDVRLYDLFWFMSPEQLDIIFDVYHFRIFRGKYVFFSRFMARRPYVVYKCLQYDRRYRYLSPLIGRRHKEKRYTLKEAMERQFRKNRKEKTESYRRCIRVIRIMINNHEKKGTSFFQLMLQRSDIVDNNFNKK